MNCPTYTTSSLVKAAGQVNIEGTIDDGFKEVWRIGTGARLTSISDTTLRRVLDGSANTEERQELEIIPLLRAFMQDIARWAKTSLQAVIAA